MLNPLVSIIIPVYNAEKFIEQMIRSVMVQTYRNLEILIVDDGSTDSSPEICKGLQQNDSRISIITQINQGPSVARNNGIDNAHGKYVLFFDADDYIEPQMVTMLVESAEKNSVDLVICGVYLEVVRNGKVQVYKKSEPSAIIRPNKAVKTYYIRTMLHNSIYTLWNKLYKLDIIKQFTIQFDPKVNFGEDLIFNLDYIYNSQSLSILSKCYYHYFQRDFCEALSSKYRWDKARIMKLWYNKLIWFINDLSDENIVSITNWLKYRWFLSCLITEMSSDKSLNEKRIHIKSIINKETFSPDRRFIGNKRYLIEKIISMRNITMIYLLAWTIDKYKEKFRSKYLKEEYNEY